MTSGSWTALFRHNPGPGIHVADSTDNLIKGNLLSSNGPAILVEANRNEMRDNRISRGGGIVVGPGNRNVIARNHVARAQESISATGRENLVARNVVVDARGGASVSASTLPTGLISAGWTTSSAETWSKGAGAMGSWSTTRAPTS